MTRYSGTTVLALDAGVDFDDERLEDLFDGTEAAWLQAARHTPSDPTLACDGLEDLFPPAAELAPSALATWFDEIFGPAPPGEPREEAPVAALSAAAEDDVPLQDGDLHVQAASLMTELQRFTDEFHTFALACQKSAAPPFAGAVRFNR